MARIYDNIDLEFNDRLNNAINTPGVKRVDVRVGYFNLRSWNMANLVLHLEDGGYALIDCKLSSQEIEDGAKPLSGIKQPIQEYNKAETSPVTGTGSLDNPDIDLCPHRRGKSYRWHA